MGLVACAGRPPAESDTPRAVLAEIQYVVQVGAFSSPERAARCADALILDGVDAYYFVDDDGLFKVRFGSFSTRGAARQQAEALLGRGLIEAFYILRPDTRRLGARRLLQAGLVSTARRFIGTPYQWGGASPRSGFDCSGLTMTVYRLNGLDLPRTAASQFHAGRPVSRHALQEGDLVFFNTGRRDRITHVGIYSGGGRFIHAPGSGKTIRSAFLDNRYFEARFAGARRYF
jgi:hypothetical protein